MTITLQRLPRTAEYEIRAVEGTDVQRSVNGAALGIDRAWDHFEIEVDVGSLAPECAREMTADLLRGRGERIRVLLPQQGIDTGAPGSVVVDGADQSGSGLDVRGATPYAVIRKGWYVTIETDGVGRLHIVAAETIVGADGTATLPLWPMLRVPPADGDSVEIAEPYLDGFRTDGGSLEMRMKASRPDSFVIEEQD